MMQQKGWWVVGGALLILLGGWLAFGYFGIQALFTDSVVNESVPEVITSSSTQPAAKIPAEFQGPLIIADGIFQQGDSTYTIRGKATVTEEDGKQTLSLTDFDVTNGPDLYVYLVKAPSADNETVKQAVSEKEFLSLGRLKGNRGNQMYEIPDDMNIGDPYVISIWCQRFFRNFGAAEISARAY